MQQYAWAAAGYWIHAPHFGGSGIYVCMYICTCACTYTLGYIEQPTSRLAAVCSRNQGDEMHDKNTSVITLKRGPVGPAEVQMVQVQFIKYPEKFRKKLSSNSEKGYKWVQVTK